MNLDYLIAAVLFVGVSVLAWMLVRQLIGFLHARQQVDIPNERSSHVGSVPRGGGLAISLLLWLSLLVSALLSSQTILYATLAALVASWAVICWWDDRSSLAPGRRFLAQCFLACFTVASFGWVSQLLSFNLGILGSVITVIGVLWMANLYNFMDGIDGIAASQAIVAGLTLASWLYFLDNHLLALNCLVVAAASYGFLLLNWQPAKIFMGDVGSVTLGAFFAMLMILLETRHNVPILSLVLLFAVFILDATTTLLIRMFKREPFWQPHRRHLYQRFVQLGFSHQRVTLGAIVLMIFCSVLATLSLAHHAMIPMFIGLELAVFIALWILFLFCQRTHKTND